jgi:hypothetical protein
LNTFVKISSVSLERTVSPKVSGKFAYVV